MKFNSQFLDQELKQLVDTVTTSNLTEVKEKLTTAMREGKHFKGEKDIITIQSARTPARLQQIYYSFILAAENNKIIK